MSSQEHFEKLVEIYNTTGKCFTYWSQEMNYFERVELCRHLECQFLWASVLEQIEIHSN